MTLEKEWNGPGWVVPLEGRGRGVNTRLSSALSVNQPGLYREILSQKKKIKTSKNLTLSHYFMAGL